MEINGKRLITGRQAVEGENGREDEEEARGKEDGPVEV